MQTGGYGELANFIENYWPTLRCNNVAESKVSFGLPHSFYAPSTEAMDRFSFPYMFYWDSYFIAQAFWGTSQEQEIVNTAENMFDLIGRFGFMPTSNSTGHMSRSQPPLLGTLVKQITDTLKNDDLEWQSWAYDSLEEEMKNAWYGDAQPHIRLVHAGLSRYYDFNVLHSMAEAESGWDYTNRFNHECLDYLPIDLNSLLYKNELVLAELAKRLERSAAANYWSLQAQTRREKIVHHMWNQESGFFYDFNYKDHQFNNNLSLAAYTAMFTGLATDEQAQQMVDNLIHFETDYGLTSTNKDDKAEPSLQWTSPNGWAPLHDMVVDGLLNYGFEADAKRIARKWLDTVNYSFKKSHHLYEKYNVVNPDEPVTSGVYPDQIGFGWTNAITFKFIKLLK